MNATQQLHQMGQSLWLDNITRGLLNSGTLGRYIREYAVTGLTSNPTIFDLAIRDHDFYDDAIRKRALAGESGEALFFELALEDLTQAADLFQSIHDVTRRVDGWVSLEVSPLLADDAAGTIRAAAQLHARAQRPNLLIKIPGTRAGLPAIEETIFAGVPVNVTLLFSREHYITSAEAYMRGIERRIAAGRDPRVASVASIFVSRWDVAAKDPAASDVLYVEALAAPDTINTMPEKTLLGFADHGKVMGAMRFDGGDAEAVLEEFSRAGIDDEALAAALQREGTEAFAKSWRDLMRCIASKSETLTTAKHA